MRQKITKYWFKPDRLRAELGQMLVLSYVWILALAIYLVAPYSDSQLIRFVVYALMRTYQKQNAGEELNSASETIEKYEKEKAMETWNKHLAVHLASSTSTLRSYPQPASIWTTAQANHSLKLA